MILQDCWSASFCHSKLAIGPRSTSRLPSDVANKHFPKLNPSTRRVVEYTLQFVNTVYKPRSTEARTTQQPFEVQIPLEFPQPSLHSSFHRTLTTTPSPKIPPLEPRTPSFLVQGSRQHFTLILSNHKRQRPVVETYFPLAPNLSAAIAQNGSSHSL